jgi:hypothetical protein
MPLGAAFAIAAESNLATRLVESRCELSAINPSRQHPLLPPYANKVFTAVSVQRNNDVAEAVLEEGR